MKTSAILAVGAIVLFQVARRYGINSIQDLRNMVTSFVEDLNLKQWINVDRLKDMVFPEKQEMTTA